MSNSQVLEVAGREVTITHPDKPLFPSVGLTKLDLVRYYLAVADGALRGVNGRPMMLKRFVKGIDQEAFFQKRAPSSRPDWIEVVELRYASGRSAEEVVVRDAAQLAWVVNLGCVDLNPHPVLAEDLDRPDELRIDLDPVPGVGWQQIVDVALVVREVLADYRLTTWPKTSGSRGFHIYARVEPHWSYRDVRLAAETVAREVENRAPDLATSRWWKEKREGVFVDFNQNAKDRTVASAYSVRPTADARVSTPLTWEELPGCRPEDYTLGAVLGRYSAVGDPWQGIERAYGSLEPLLDLARRLGPAEKPPKGEGRRQSGSPAVRQSTMPLVEIARAKTKEEALEGLERWKARHPGCGRPPAGRRHTGGRHARKKLGVVPDPRQPPARAGRRALAAGAARRGLQPLDEPALTAQLDPEQHPLAASHDDRRRPPLVGAEHDVLRLLPPPQQGLVQARPQFVVRRLVFDAESREDVGTVTAGEPVRLRLAVRLIDAVRSSVRLRQLSSLAHRSL